MSDEDNKNAEERIDSEFIHRLYDSDVHFDVEEVMADLIYEDDYGGEEGIVDRVESEVIEDGD